ncbi:tetratricopeptide repeat-containing protein [Pholiota molesta]|nr:tetratricopeptide repeat-containing protein [Pholiota molesta]
MAPHSNPTRKMDKFKAIFRRKTRQPPEPTSNATTIPSQSSSDNAAPTAQNAPDIHPPPLTSNTTLIPPQPSSDNKVFVKSKTLEKDIAVLSITYILADNPELKRLVHLIVAIHDKDEDDQLIGVLETCARFAVQLASIAETHPTEASEATTEFIATIEKINLEPNVLSLDTVARMVDDEIVKVKSSHPLLARGSDFGTSGRLSKVLTATIGAGITIFSVAKDASAVIPVPFVQSTIGGVVNLLNAVAQTRSNYDDMKQIEATAGENCDELSKLNTLWRYLQNNVQKGTLQGIRTNLDSAIKLFQTESQIHMQLDIKDISKKLDDATLNSLPNHPRYDAVDYLDKSRDDALQHISAWIDKPRKRSSGSMAPLGWENRPQASSCGGGEETQWAHNPLRDYFKAYIIDPISQLKYPYQLVVVLDGLEEWENHESFLPELAHLPSPSPVKFILTSRPSYSVERILNKIAIQRYPLPPVSQEIVECYFSHHFERIDWRGRKPDQLVINRLATHAQGLLIWAATVCSLLSHKFDERPPHEILERIFWSEEKVGAQSGKQLERLYRGAISTLFPEDMRGMLRNFLGAMMVLQEPLPVGDFARLLGMPDHLAEQIQQHLAAFQTRGEFKSSIVPPAIQQFHFSFLEFMESRSTEHNGQPITVDTANSHSMLANRCLEIVFSEFLLSYRGTTCSYSELRGVNLYAIKFWPLHIANGSTRPPVPSPSPAQDPMDMISEQDMRHWATLFLPCIAARFQVSHGYESLDNTPRSSLPYQLATIIGENDVTTLSYQLHCLEIAVRLKPINVPTWMALGRAYVRLYEHSRNIQSLDEVISIFRRTLLLLPTPHPDRSMLLNNLATALRSRFQHRGVPTDLDQSISFHQEALLLHPVPHPDRSMSLNNLALALRTRFEHRGVSTDLDQSILFYQEALLLRPVPHLDRSTLLNNLATALCTRFRHQGVPSDLDEAILFHQEALLLCPVPHPDRSMLLSNLAIALCTRSQHRGVPSDLDEAILFHQEALLLCPVRHPDRSSLLKCLAIALQTRFTLQGTINDREEANLLRREAEALVL